MGFEVWNHISRGKDGGMRKLELQSWSHWCAGVISEQSPIETESWIIRWDLISRSQVTRTGA